MAKDPETSDVGPTVSPHVAALGNTGKVPEGNLSDVIDPSSLLSNPKPNSTPQSVQPPTAEVALQESATSAQTARTLLVWTVSLAPTVLFNLFATHVASDREFRRFRETAAILLWLQPFLLLINIAAVAFIRRLLWRPRLQNAKPNNWLETPMPWALRIAPLTFLLSFLLVLPALDILVLGHAFTLITLAFAFWQIDKRRHRGGNFVPKRAGLWLWIGTALLALIAARFWSLGSTWLEFYLNNGYENKLRFEFAKNLLIGPLSPVPVLLMVACFDWLRSNSVNEGYPAESLFGKILQGLVRGLQDRHEHIWTVRTFRLERLEVDGTRLPLIGVEMKGATLTGLLSEGDEVRMEIPAGWSPGATLEVRSIENLTANSVCEVH